MATSRSDRLVSVALFSLMPLAAGGFVGWQYLSARHADQTARQEADEKIRTSLGYVPPPPPPWVPPPAPPFTFWEDKPRTRPADGWVAFLRHDPDTPGGYVRVVSPAGELVGFVEGFRQNYTVRSVRISPNGKRLAVTVYDRGRTQELMQRGHEPLTGSSEEVLVYDLDAPGPPAARIPSDTQVGLLGWTADGQVLVFERYEWKMGTKERVGRPVRFDLRTRAETPVTLPDGYHLRDVAADGTTFLLTHSPSGQPDRPESGSYLSTAADPTPRQVARGVWLTRLSPDGTRAVGQREVKPRELPNGMLVDQPGEVVVVNLADGGEQVLATGDDRTYLFSDATWSADGQRLLVSRVVLLPGEKRPQRPKRYIGIWTAEPLQTAQEVTVRRPDGSDPQPFPAGDGASGFDWR